MWKKLSPEAWACGDTRVHNILYKGSVLLRILLKIVLKFESIFTLTFIIFCYVYCKFMYPITK